MKEAGRTIKSVTLYGYKGGSPNGGTYEYIKQIEYIGNGLYQVLYSITTSLPYCELCGNFGHNCGCEKPSYLTEEEVKSLIKAHSDIYADVKYFESTVEEWMERLKGRVIDALKKTTDEATIVSCAVALGVYNETTEEEAERTNWKGVTI